jgi:hypothetical protein
MYTQRKIKIEREREREEEIHRIQIGESVENQWLKYGARILL